jgi:NADH-quinone oxidoreductase subunit M
VTPELIKSNLILILFFLPLVGAFFIAFSKDEMAKPLARIFSVLLVLCSLWMLSMFDPNANFQFEHVWRWVSVPFPIDFNVAVDGFSMCLVLLTTVVGALSIWASETVGQTRPKLYYSFVLLLLFSILGVFVSRDLLMFFIMYEFELVPMYFLIAIWGGPRRDYAAMKFLIYTFFGGVLMLAGLLYAYFNLYAEAPSLASFSLDTLMERCPMLPIGVQVTAFLGFFLAFIIKLPSFPFHTWLPDAHVEAPTPISMILAGLLLKMGSYGLFRICIGLFPQVVIDYGWMIMALGCFNIVWAAIACLVQKDMKRIIAFSSVSHMGFILLGMGALSSAAMNGAIFQMVSHGFISALARNWWRLGARNADIVLFLDVCLIGQSGLTDVVRFRRRSLCLLWRIHRLGSDSRSARTRNQNVDLLRLHGRGFDRRLHALVAETPVFRPGRCEMGGSFERCSPRRNAPGVGVLRNHFGTGHLSLHADQAIPNAR